MHQRTVCSYRNLDMSPDPESGPGFTFGPARGQVQSLPLRLPLLVCRELFTAEGNEFYIFPAARYIHQNETLDFYQLLARGRMRQEARVLSVCSQVFSSGYTGQQPLAQAIATMYT